MTVLVADDSILFRRVLVGILSELPDVTVVGQASNGKLAIQKTRELVPDVLTLDLEMPEFDGLAVLDALRSGPCFPKVLVVSSLSRHGGELALKALAKGAFDFITKPESSNLDESSLLLKEALAPRIRALALQLGVRSILKGSAIAEPKVVPAVTVPKSAIDTEAAGLPVRLTGISERMNRLGTRIQARFILVGVSTGGPNALAVLLASLQPIGMPVFVVQHMPPLFTQTLAENLDKQTGFRVREASDGELAASDTVYIAPGGRHLKLTHGPGTDIILRITDDPPENNCRPAVDYLFRSAAYQFPGQALAVILTGMGEDGTLGLRLLKRSSCPVIAQDESSCVVFGMPKAAIEAGLVDEVLPLQDIAPRLNSLLRGHP